MLSENRWQTRAVKARLVATALAAIALSGCGGSSNPHPPKQTVGVYFFRHSALTRVPIEIAPTKAVATAALGALLSGPPRGYETALPDDVQLMGLAVVDGSATATFSRKLGLPTRSAQGQIVSTLTQFPTIRRVAIDVAGRGAVPLTDGAEKPLGSGATRADYVDLTSAAPIFVREPARDSTVTSPVRARGTATTFEATVAAEVWSGRKLLRTQTINATAGNGTRGTWKATFRLPPGPAKLVFYEPSAEDGSHLHTTTVFLTVS
jgi:sporulation and spore germination protein/immunoglobulin-like protein involved in spore germination